jgi:hypothetical protein
MPRSRYGKHFDHFVFKASGFRRSKSEMDQLIISSSSTLLSPQYSALQGSPHCNAKSLRCSSRTKMTRRRVSSHDYIQLMMLTTKKTKASLWQRSSLRMPLPDHKIVGLFWISCCRSSKAIVRYLLQGIAEICKKGQQWLLVHRNEVSEYPARFHFLDNSTGQHQLNPHPNPLL